MISLPVGGGAASGRGAFFELNNLTEDNMPLKKPLIRLATLLLILCLNPAVSAEEKVNVVGMTGDKDAVWIATSNNKLIYCWWPQDPSRLDRRAQCRVLDKLGVDRLQ